MRTTVPMRSMPPKPRARATPPFDVQAFLNRRASLRAASDLPRAPSCSPREPRQTACFFVQEGSVKLSVLSLVLHDDLRFAARAGGRAPGGSATIGLIRSNFWTGPDKRPCDRLSHAEVPAVLSRRTGVGDSRRSLDATHRARARARSHRFNEIERGLLVAT